MITALAGMLRLILLDQHPFSDAELAALGPVSPISPAPLLQVIYAIIARFTELTPQTARLVPAMAGTMTVPASYFLVRQWFSPRVALIVSLLVACSTILLVHSREATAVAPVVLLATLSFGFLLHWFRTETRAAWLGWVVSSIAMLGFGAAGLLVLAVQPLFIVFRKRSIVIDPARSSPAMTSLRFWSAAVLQEARAALLVAIGLFISVSGFAGYLLAHRAAWPAIPRFDIQELAPRATQIVFGFRWTPDAAVTSVMTLTVAATAAMLLLCIIAPLLRVPAKPVWSTLIALFVVINLTLFAARFAMNDRPPKHLLARDTSDAQQCDAIAAFGVGTGLRMPAYDAAAVGASAHLKRVYVWEVGTGQNVGVLAPPPGAGWRLCRDNRYAVYDPWTWRRVSTWHRREFVRTGPLPEPEPEKDLPATRRSLFRSAVSQPGSV
jgi:hypothetical protein